MTAVTATTRQVHAQEKRKDIGKTDIGANTDTDKDTDIADKKIQI